MQISCIICSRQPDISAELKENIASTIGCEYELVVIDNSKNEYSIFSAYNEAVCRAKGDIYCFMHEDILYHTKGWGNKIFGLFNDESVGIIGFAGSHVMPKAPTYWSLSPYVSEYFMQNDLGNRYDCIATNYMNNSLADVVAVDGMCFYMRSSLFEQIHFDEEHYNDFHAYDMDICMQVQDVGKRVCVTNAVLIEHAWTETLLKNRGYMDRLDKNMIIFYNKWRHLLPMVRGVELSERVIQGLNNLCIQAYDATRIRRSKAYLLGKFILHPNYTNLKKLLNR